MDTRRGTCRMALALVALALRPPTTEAQLTAPAPVVIRAYGMAKLPPGVADRAQEVVGQIYSAAGTHLEWRADGSTPDIPGGFQIAVLFRRQSDDDTPLSVLGFAPSARGRLVYVLYDHVERFAAANHLDIGHALGHVVAHEVGHVLLPTGEHSRTGLMTSNLNHQSLRMMPHGALTFTARQAAEIRARLTASEGAVALNSEF